VLPDAPPERRRVRLQGKAQARYHGTDWTGAFLTSAPIAPRPTASAPSPTRSLRAARPGCPPAASTGCRASPITASKP
jgi:hypothetical protein